MDDPGKTEKRAQKKVEHLIEKWRFGGNGRVQAEEELRSLTAFETSVLLHHLTAQKAKLEASIQMPLAIAVLAIVFLSPIEKLLQPPVIKFTYIAVLTMFPFMFAVAYWYFVKKDDSAQIISVLQAKRTFATLLENVHSPSGRVRVSSRQALIKVLPELNIDDVIFITSGVRANIHGALLTRLPPSFCLF